MDSRQIEELLKKYWDCETNLEEEEQLRTFFRGGDVPEHLRDTAKLFQYFQSQKSTEVKDPSFEKIVIGEIRKSNRVSGGKVRQLVITTMRIAAGVAVLLAAVYMVRLEIRQDDPVAMEDTYETPEQAFEETKKALMMISKGFGKAEQQARKINLFNEAQEKIKEGTVTDESNL